MSSPTCSVELPVESIEHRVFGPVHASQRAFGIADERRWDAVVVKLDAADETIIVSDHLCEVRFHIDGLRAFSEEHPEPTRLKGRAFHQAITIASYQKRCEIWLVSSHGVLSLELRIDDGEPPVTIGCQQPTNHAGESHGDRGEGDSTNRHPEAVGGKTGAEAPGMPTIGRAGMRHRPAAGQ